MSIKSDFINKGPDETEKQTANQLKLFKSIAVLTSFTCIITLVSYSRTSNEIIAVKSKNDQQESLLIYQKVTIDSLNQINIRISNNNQK